jgi:hypothetical protein
MSNKLETLIQNSPAWKQATQAMNEVVKEANQKGIKLTDGERHALREMRILSVMLADEKVRKAVAEDVWETINRKKA